MTNSKWVEIQEGATVWQFSSGEYRSSKGSENVRQIKGEGVQNIEVCMFFSNEINGDLVQDRKNTMKKWNWNKIVVLRKQGHKTFHSTNLNFRDSS